VNAKYANILLTIILIFLITISLRLVHVAILLANFNENMQFLTNSHQELVIANRNLKKTIAGLSAQIALIEEKVGAIKKIKTIPMKGGAE
jgi:hypothetical protein